MARFVLKAMARSTRKHIFMPITLAPLQINQSLQNSSIIGGAGDHQATESGGIKGNSREEVPPAKKEAPQAEKVNLSAAKLLSNSWNISVAPFAEVWKDGQKVAEIDVRGEVTTSAGMIAALPGGGSGLSLAAQRAALVAQSVGGEIRVAGMITDFATLTMRNRLREAYGI